MGLHVRLGSPAASLSVARMVAGLCVASLIPLFVSLGAAAESCPRAPSGFSSDFRQVGQPIFPGGQSRSGYHSPWARLLLPRTSQARAACWPRKSLSRNRRTGTRCSICTYFDPVNTLLYRKARYKVSDIAPVSLIGTYDYVLAVANSVPADTLSKLVEISKASPDKFNYGHIGIGSPANLIFKQLEKRTGIMMTAVPFKGSAPAMQELLAGRTRSLYRAADQCGSSLRCQSKSKSSR